MGLAYLSKVPRSSREQQIYPWWCCRHSRWRSVQGWGLYREGLSSSPVQLRWMQKKKSETPWWAGPMGIPFLNWKCISVLQTKLPFSFSRLMIVQLTKVLSSVPFSFALVCLEKTIFSDIIHDVLINWRTASTDNNHGAISKWYFSNPPRFPLPSSLSSVLSKPLKSTKTERASLGILPQVNLGPFIQNISERRESPPLLRPTTWEKENQSVGVTGLPSPMPQIQGSRWRRRTSRDGFWSQLDCCRNTRPRQGETQTEGEAPTIWDLLQHCSQTNNKQTNTQTTGR